MEEKRIMKTLRQTRKNGYKTLTKKKVKKFMEPLRCTSKKGNKKTKKKTKKKGPWKH